MNKRYIIFLLLIVSSSSISPAVLPGLHSSGKNSHNKPAVQLPVTKPRLEILFSPDDSPVSKLIRAINKAKVRILVAMYMLSDKNIADALIAARNRNVHVELIVDPLSMGKYGKAQYLMQAGIPVYVMASPSNGFSAPLMHHKMGLIDDEVWSGSMNWTIAGNDRNQENVIITNDPGIMQRCEAQFQIVKQRATRCTNALDLYYLLNADLVRDERQAAARQPQKKRKRLVAVAPQKRKKRQRARQT